MEKKKRIEILDQVIKNRQDGILNHCSKKTIEKNKNVFKKINIQFTILYGQVWAKNFGLSDDFDKQFEKEWLSQLEMYSEDDINQGVERIKCGSTSYNKFPPSLMDFKKIVHEVYLSKRINDCEFINCKNRGLSRFYVGLNSLSRIFCDQHHLLIDKIDDMCYFLTKIEYKNLLDVYMLYFLRFSSPPSDKETVNTNLCNMFGELCKGKFQVDYYDIAEKLEKAYEDKNKKH